MRNLFKNNKSKEIGLSEREMQFILTIVNGLDSKYPIFKNQLDSGMFLWISPNSIGGEGSFTFGIDDNLWKSFANPSVENFLIKNIVFKNNKSERVRVDLYTMEGLLVGYGTTDQLEHIDLNTIQVSNIWEEHSINKDFSSIQSFFVDIPKGLLNKLNVFKNAWMVKVQNKEYYIIHDLSDGNYFGVDGDGAIFKMTHGPFQIVKISDNVKDFLEMLTAQQLL